MGCLAGRFAMSGKHSYLTEADDRSRREAGIADLTLRSAAMHGGLVGDLPNPADLDQIMEVDPTTPQLGGAAQCAKFSEMR